MKVRYHFESYLVIVHQLWPVELSFHQSIKHRHSLTVLRLNKCWTVTSTWNRKPGSPSSQHLSEEDADLHQTSPTYTPSPMQGSSMPDWLIGCVDNLAAWNITICPLGKGKERRTVMISMNTAVACTLQLTEGATVLLSRWMAIEQRASAALAGQAALGGN